VPYGEGAPAGRVAERLRADATHQIRAVLVVHNETSTGVTSDVAAVRRALDDARHPALLLVDVVSSLASIDFRFDEWGVDVALTGPQKGLMLPPGLTILAASDRALRASQAAKCPRAYWDWGPVLERNKRGEFPSRHRALLDSASRSRCCTRKACRGSSRVTPASPRRVAAPSARSASGSSAASPASTRTR
jgi:aspartate aminotransferase-like enzyme